MPTELSEIARASARGSFFLFLGNTSSTIILAVASILTARLLGPENYGLYAVAMIAPSFLIVLSDLGISQALTRFSARYHSTGEDRKVASLINAGIIFKLGFSLLLSLVLLLFSESIATSILRRPGLGLLVSFTSLYLVGQAIFMTLNSIFIGLDKTEKSGVLMNIQAVTKIVVSPLLIILGMGAVGAILGAGLGFLFAAGTGIAILLLRIYPSLHRRDSGDNVNFLQGLRRMVHYGMPLYLSTLISSLVAQYGSYILALFVSNVEIGNYRIAMNFSVLITLLSYPISTSLFPAFSKMNIRDNREEVENMFKLSIKYTALLIIPASFAIAVLSNDAVDVLYGLQYGLAPSYLSLYIFSFLGTGIGMIVLDNFFNGQGDTMTTLKMNVISLGLSVPMAFFLTPLYNVYGLLASILVSQFLSTTYGLLLARKKYAVTVDWTSSFKTGVAALSSALLVYIFISFVPIASSILKLAIGGSLYMISFLAFVPLLKVISKVDIENLHELLKGIAPIYPIARRILNFEEKILALNFSI